jgi:hypothetical protein
MTSENQKDKVLKLIQESREKDRKIYNTSGEFLRDAQHGIDRADASGKFLKGLPNTIDFTPAIRAWQYRNKEQNLILKGLENIPITTLTASGSTVSSTMFDYTNLQRIWDDDLENIPQIIFEDAEHLKQVIERDIDKSDMISLLKSFGFSTTKLMGEKTPVELFETAWEAFEKPVTLDNPVSTSLIPIRGCINLVIDALCKRRPLQKPTGKPSERKLLSICNQLSWEGVSKEVIEDRAKKGKELMKALSGSKNKNYSRQEWNNLLRRATLFLRELLESLDQSKMK